MARGQVHGAMRGTYSEKEEGGRKGAMEGGTPTR